MGENLTGTLTSGLLSDTFGRKKVAIMGIVITMSANFSLGKPSLMIFAITE